MALKKWRWLRIHDREIDLQHLILILNERLKALADFLGDGGGGGAADYLDAAEGYFYNAGSVLVAGDSEYLFIPFNFTITLAEIVADQVGAMDVEVWASSYPDWNTFTKISAASPVSLAGNFRAHNSALAGWTKTFTGGTYFLFRIIGTPALVRKATVSLYLSATSPLLLTEAGGVVSGTAGGVLSGTYPNPGFAEDMATQIELNAEATARAAADALKADQTYVDTKLAAIPWKSVVRAKTTANISLSGGGIAAGTTHDGVTLATGDRVLVASQTAPSENGIYVAPASGAATRATDADSSLELVNATCYVAEGTTKADTLWSCTTNAPITVGTTALTFAQLSSGGAGRATPTIVQSANIRGDTTIALASTPTVGNLLIWVFAGFSGTESTYAPTGFTLVNTYNSDSNNRVACYWRRVKSGDTGSYALSATDNQGGALYEFSNASFVYAIVGGAMSAYFSSTTLSLPVPDSPYEGAAVRLVALEQDVDGRYTITAATGLSVDYNPASGANHQGAVISLADSFGTALIGGSVSLGPTQPVYGVWTVVGKKA